MAPIGIAGVCGLRNRGVEALVLALLDALPEPAAGDVRVFSLTPDHDVRRLDRAGVSVRPDGVLAVRGRRAALLASMSTAADRVSGRLSARLSPAYRATAAEIAACRLLLVTGGDVFGSDYGDLLTALLRELRIAREAHVPYVLLGHSIGPFADRSDADRFVAEAQGAALITVRESASYDYVTSQLGLSPDRVVRTADIAFLLRPSRDGAGALQRAHGIGSGPPVVALAPSEAICKYRGHDHDRHAAVWVDVARHVLDRMGARVLLVPHVQEIHGHSDDRVLATRVLRALDHDPRVALAGGDYTAREFKTLIAGCALVVAERMHAAIAGLSSGVPTVAIGYSVKADGIMRDLFGEDARADGVLLPLERFLDRDEAIRAISAAWAARGRIADRLRETLPAVRAAARRNVDLLHARGLLDPALAQAA